MYFDVLIPLRIVPYLELLRHVALMITAMQRKRVGRRKNASPHQHQPSDQKHSRFSTHENKQYAGCAKGKKKKEKK